MDGMMKVVIWDFNDNEVEVPMFQLLQFRHSLHLEMKGLKHSRGSVAAHVRRLLGCPKRYPIELLSQHIDSSVEDIQDQLGIK
jgi:hypothetical protein